VTKDEVKAHIRAIGILPAIRVSSPEDAKFAAEEVCQGGIPIVEITMTVPEALQVVTELARDRPELVVGAGTVLDLDTAHRCLDAGARFLTSTGLDVEIVELALKESVVVIPGALTPTEVITAWKAGADFVKVFPCSQVGGPSYIRALKSPLPHVPLIASGGVNQQTAGDFILAGAVALGVGAELIPHDAILERNAAWIAELARRFIAIVKRARLKKTEAHT
jgi:2-dehydro-3-deoxyphosphogluconate aldolase/(4S)-4-hydroxy-2-oxoglutarate aldolase